MTPRKLEATRISVDWTLDAVRDALRQGIPPRTVQTILRDARERIEEQILKMHPSSGLSRSAMSLIEVLETDGGCVARED